MQIALTYNRRKCFFSAATRWQIVDERWIYIYFLFLWGGVRSGWF